MFSKYFLFGKEKDPFKVKYDDGSRIFHFGIKEKNP